MNDTAIVAGLMASQRGFSLNQNEGVFFTVRERHGSCQANNSASHNCDVVGLCQKTGSPE